MNKYNDSIGLDIGGTNLRIGRVNQNFDAHGIKVIPSASIFSSGDSVEKIVGFINDYISEFFSDAMPVFISIGLPAVLDKNRHEIFSATNFPGLQGHFYERISSQLPSPIILEHDAYFLLAYDMQAVKVDPHSTCVGIYFGTGLGTAIFMNGEPYTGKNGTAAELGHLSIPFDTRLCSCGNRGCIEMYCCGKALEMIHSDHFLETPISDLFLQHRNTGKLQDFITYMAIPIAAIANILDPDHIFIGGGIPNMTGFPKSELESAVRRITRKPFPESNLSLFFSDNNPEKGIIGAIIEGARRLNLKKTIPARPQTTR